MGTLEIFKVFVKAALVIGSPEHTEMYWFLLELFTESDPDKDGIVMLTDFSAMVDKALESPKDSETSLHQPMRPVQLRHLQPLYVRQGDRGQEGVQEGGEREERATQLHNTVQLYSAAC